MISICIAYKNREQALINYLIESMNTCIDSDQFILCVGSNDPINDKILEKWKGPIEWNYIPGEFERSKNLNAAAKKSPEEKLFFCDVDMTLPEDFVQQYEENVASKKVWFPVCFSLAKEQERKIDNSCGWWRYTGYGMVGILKNDWLKIEKWNETITTYGREDNDFFERCKSHNFEIIIDPRFGLFHNWHSGKNIWNSTPPQFRYLLKKEDYQ